MQDLSHVLAGYHATIANPRTSPEAKKVRPFPVSPSSRGRRTPLTDFDSRPQHAEECIKELESHSGQHEKDPKHVVAGLKAALTNEHVRGSSQPLLSLSRSAPRR